jgi:hypothetical protein
MAGGEMKKRLARSIKSARISFDKCVARRYYVNTACSSLGTPSGYVIIFSVVHLHCRYLICKRRSKVHYFQYTSQCKAIVIEIALFMLSWRTNKK